MIGNLIQSPVFGLLLFVFLLFLTAVYAITISKWSNHDRDAMFQRLATQYGLQAIIAGSTILRPDPPAESQDYCEMRKLSGIVQGKKVIIQDIEDYPAEPSDNALARHATPDRVSISRNNASHPVTRFFREGSLVSSTDIWASEKQITSFLDSTSE
jgi:hypothetical protein